MPLGWGGGGTKFKYLNYAMAGVKEQILKFWQYLRQSSIFLTEIGNKDKIYETYKTRL